MHRTDYSDVAILEAGWDCQPPEVAQVDDEQHHVQDALELYAVALMQRVAQDLGIAITTDADQKFAAFESYATTGDYMLDWFDTGKWAVYKHSCELHLPNFVERLATAFPDQRFDFVDVEARYRAEGRKGDFIVIASPSDLTTSVSLKNYRSDALRPQFNAQTYNSFVLGFLFDSIVGVHVDPTTGLKFKGSTVLARDAALVANGYSAIVPSMHLLDELNREIKAQFVYDGRFAVLDEEGEAIFDAARKRVGNAGADIVMVILEQLSSNQIKSRLLKMTGFDGAEQLLLMDPVRSTDTITNPRFRALRDIVQSGHVEFVRRGQSIIFTFVNDAQRVLPVNVPFTINKNGAWISDRATPPEGAFHRKEGVVLRYGDRRPKKSKELATSINTWVDFVSTGIFD